MAEEELARGRDERERQLEQLAILTAEAATARDDKAKIEAEMRLVLRAMDAQKAAATRNLTQLSRIYDDWSAAANS